MEIFALAFIDPATHPSDVFVILVVVFLEISIQWPFERLSRRKRTKSWREWKIGDISERANKFIVSRQKPLV